MALELRVYRNRAHRYHQKVWYGAMRIRFSALQERSPAEGQTFRINLFRSQGPNHVRVTWRPTMHDTFHAPESFGLLRLTKTGE
jgi:hypothetical protein